MPRKPKIVERKLGRERAAGQAWHGENLVEVDPRQTPKDYLGTVVHELLHLQFPELSEGEVEKAEEFITNGLWGSGFRKCWLQ